MKNKGCFLSVFLLTALAGCRDKEAPPKQTPTVPSARFIEGRKKWLAQIAHDSPEFILPAPKDFKPESASKKLSLRILLEKPAIRRGQPLRYRLELQNLGRKSILLSEHNSSFIKSGVFSWPSRFHCYVTPPDTKTRPVRTLLAGAADAVEIPVPNARFMTQGQAEETLNEMNERARQERELSVDIQPGETLVTQSEPKGSGFRDLKSDPGLLKSPGKYSIHCAYEDPAPSVPTKKESEELVKRGVSLATQKMMAEAMKDASLGIIESNNSSFTVLP